MKTIAGFDQRRAWLRGPDAFRRFNVPAEGERLAAAQVDPGSELIIVERRHARRAFLVRELARPHGAQGELAGEPYLVSF